MENLILRPKGAKKPSRIKKEVIQFRESHSAVAIPSTSSSEPPLQVTLDEAVANLLKKIKFFQDRAHDKNPIKAKAHRRILYGFREIRRDCNLLKAVIIARDIESITEESELHKLIKETSEKCRENGIPQIIALKRSKLARIFNKPRSIGAVGIVDYSGAEVLFDSMISSSVNLSQTNIFHQQNI